ncbi:MAG TPA: oligopeptide/dipeptide ABC transporter ATP-binding protein [Actinomycetota bacterium]|nr:oligopeptide/dipeptide ABC transporter ATP-binding protein [Actinomycetota bacterium]
MQTRPDGGPRAEDPVDDVLLDVRDLRTHFTLRGSFAERVFGSEKGVVRAVDGVSFQLRRGEVFGLVGESGSGKTTLGRTILGLAPATSGSIALRGREVANLSESAFRPLRRQMQMVFQDPHASLNPAMDLLTAIGHPLSIHGIAKDREAIRAAVADVLVRVGLSPAEQFMGKYPSDLSGGQKQRAVLARALILGPELIVADEPVSMLDMSVRAKILELMLTLKRELDLTYVYITHDLATAKFFCDRVAIMYLGRIVEIGPTEVIFADPKHPYTVSLLKAIPDPDPSRTIPRDLPRGEVPDAITPPIGCTFHPRCPRAFEVCGWESRDLRDLIESRWTGMDENEFERERELVGDLEELEVATTTAQVPAGRHRSGTDVLDLLRRMRDADPDEPLWRGVRDQRLDGDHAVVDFHDPVEPHLMKRGEAEVSCHLYDDEVLAHARALTGTPPR